MQNPIDELLNDETVGEAAKAVAKRFLDAAQIDPVPPLSDTAQQAWDSVSDNAIVSLQVPKKALQTLFNVLRQTTMLPVMGATFAGNLHNGRQKDAEDALIEMLATSTKMRNALVAVEQLFVLAMIEGNKGGE